MQDDDSPVELIQVANELLAAPLVAVLEAAGIETRVVGRFTAGFFAEAPGTAQIMVRTSDLAAAQEILDRYSADEEAAADDEQSAN